MEKIYKTAIYLRLSRDDECTGESCSISNQRKLLETFADDKEDLKVVNEYVDDGYTGYDFERPGFKQMISDINDGIIDCVIVKDLSRLGRNFQKTEEYIQRIFPNKNVRFIAVSDCFDSIKEFTSTDRLAYPMKNLINEYHVMETSMKIRNVFEHYRQTGKLFTGNAVYGYTIKDRHYVIDEEAAAVVRMIFRMKISGMSNQGIAEELNDMGIGSPLEYKKSKGGGDTGAHFQKGEKALWQSVSIRRVLENPIYIGTLIQGKTTSASYKDHRRYERDPSELVAFEHSHDAIIPETMFYIVQDLLSKDSYTKAAAKKSYLFSGFAFCGNCGNILYHENGGGKPFWVCKNKACSCKARLLENKLIDGVFGALKLHVDSVIKTVHDENKGAADKTVSEKKVSPELQKQLEQTISAKDKLAEYMDSGMLSKSDCDELSVFYDMKIDKLKSDIESTAKAKVVYADAYDEINLMYDDLADMKELTRAMIATFIDKIEVVDKKNIKVFFRFRDIFDLEDKTDGKEVKKEQIC